MSVHLFIVAVYIMTQVVFMTKWLQDSISQNLGNIKLQPKCATGMLWIFCKINLVDSVGSFCSAVFYLFF